MNEIEDHEDRAASSDASEELQTVCDAIESVEEKNMQLKADLERASAQLKSLQEEMTKFGQPGAEAKKEDDVSGDV